MRTYCSTVAAALTFGLAACVLADPAVFWASDPVRPGEVVAVQGGGWGEQPKVELSWLRDGEPGAPTQSGALQPQRTEVLTPVQSSAHAVKFLVPASWKPGIYSFRVVAGEAKSTPVMLNAPDPWWQQGDWGKEASPGGWLRVLGKCLSQENQAHVALRAGDRWVELKPQSQDGWSIAVTLPAELPSAEYEVFVHNGCGGPLGWRSAGVVRITAHPPLWKPKEFNVRDFGALPNDAMEDGDAIQAALDAAGANGGGIVAVPSGRYQVNRTLSIPRFVLLRGEAPELSMIYWRDRMDPLPALIEGTNSFSIQDLTLHATNHLEGIVSDGADKPGAGSILLHRVHLRMNRYVQIHPSREGMEEVQRRTGGWLHGLKLSGENVQVTDCEVYSSTSPFSLGGSHCLVRGNRFFTGRWNSFVVHGTEMICEDNLIRGMDNQTWGGANYIVQHGYFARNQVGPGFGGDREQFTTDGGGVAYVGPVASVDGARMTLAEDPLWASHSGWDWTRHHTGAFIMQGTGAGQLRELVKYAGRQVELERPWDIPPDRTSVVYLSRRNSHHLIVDNEFTEATIAVQLYVEADHCILAGNRSIRAGGFHAQGFAAMPCWFVQFLGNEIVEGSGFNGPWNDQPPSDSHMAVYDKGGYWPEGKRRLSSPTVRCTVLRRNVLCNHARIETVGQVQDTLIENCTVRNADVGIAIGGGAEGTVLLGNRFENVKQPLTGPLDAVLLHPAERLRSRLSGAGVVPAELAGADAWRKAWQQLSALAEENPTAAGLAERVRQCHLGLLEAAAHSGKPYPLEFLQAVCGIGVAYASRPLQPLLASGSGGSASLLIIATPAASSPPMSLSLEFPPLPGWQIGPVRDLKLAPGGKAATVHVPVTLPRGAWGKPTVPVACAVRGEGWELKGRGSACLDIGPTDFVTEWMIVGPFESDRPGELGEKVYPPHRRLDLAAECPGINGPARWQAVSLGDKVGLDFGQYFGKPEKGVAFAVAALRARKPTPVAITFGPGHPAQAFSLNGQTLGIPFRFGNRRVTRVLQQGENILLSAEACRDGNWSQQVQVEVIRTAEPGDVQVVPAAELAALPALRPTPLPPTPQGTALPFSEGVDWRLVYEDNFDRNWLGTDWRTAEGKWDLKGGALAADGSWAYLAYARKLTPPLRVEADISALPDRRPSWILGFCLTPEKEIAGRALWGTTRGAGYMLALGWHNRRSNQVWRKEQEVLVSPKGPFLEAGKKHHVIAQFVPPRLLLVVDGQVSLDYTDKERLPDLDTFSIFSGWSRDGIDAMRFYRSKE